MEGGVREDCPYLSSILIYFDGGDSFSNFLCVLAQCTSDIDNSVAKRLDTGKTVVYCRTQHLVGKLFLYLFIEYLESDYLNAMF